MDHWPITTVLACYGAFVTTYPLLRDRHRLKIRIESDNRMARQVNVEILNRGGKPSTVIEVQIVAFENVFWRLLGFASCTWYLRPDGDDLQTLLPPGGCYRKSFPLREPWFHASPRIEQGCLIYRVRMSHSDRRFSGRVTNA